MRRTVYGFDTRGEAAAFRKGILVAVNPAVRSFEPIRGVPPGGQSKQWCVTVENAHQPPEEAPDGRKA